MGFLKDFLMERPWLYRLVAPFHRYRLARSYYTPKLRLIRQWLFRSRETTNFTYDLQPVNQQYLAAFVSDITGCPIEQVEGYMSELTGDQPLKDHVARRISEDPKYRMRADLETRFSRRLGWYAFVRALKPSVVVETGIDKGLGSIVLTSALARNAKDGKAGRYYGTDINPAAGYLFQPPYSEHGKILYGDSCQSLRNLNERVDLFINDSDHSAEYEGKEYETIEPKLSEDAVILGDNAEVTDQLYRFARRSGRGFLFFQEWPKDHWFPGGGIGVAFRRRGNSS